MNTLLADLLLVLHGAFVLFVAAGGLLALRWPSVVWVHLPAALWGALIELGGWVCPLTPWEAQLRFGAGGEAGETDFIERVLTPLIYPGWLTRELQIALGCGVILLNGVVYGFAVARWRARRAGH